MQPFCRCAYRPKVRPVKALTYLKHLTSTLTVAGSDEWSVDIQETMLLEKVVGCESQGIPYPGNGSNCVCPAALNNDIRHS